MKIIFLNVKPDYALTTFEAKIKGVYIYIYIYMYICIYIYIYISR